MHTSQKKIATLISTAAIAATLLCVSAYAQDAASSVAPVPAPASEPAAVPAPAATVPLISGGVGEQELAQLKAVEKQYNLKLLFAETNGVYLAQVPVTITDKQGNKVVDTITKGPILLVTLPAGFYSVSATQEGVTKEQKVTVGGKFLKEYIVRFPSRDPVVDDTKSKQ